MSHPYIELRKKIRAATKQYRHNTDNSPSLFHPDGGFVYAIEMEKLEALLDEYEQTMPSEYLSVAPANKMESEILSEAQGLCRQHSDMEVRDFARQVMAHMVIHEGYRLQA